MIKPFVQVLILALVSLAIGCGTVEKPVPPSDVSDQMFSLDGDLAATHILIAYQGAERADEAITRTREEAQELANKLNQEVLTAPDQLESLAREHSNGSTAAEGGNLSPWKRGTFIEPFDEAVDSLQVGAILKTPLETPFGFHIIRRDPVKFLHVAAEGFSIAFRTESANPAKVSRNRDEAEALATKVAPKVNSQTFDELAAIHNDLGDEPIFLGVAHKGTELPNGAFDLIQTLGYGQVGGPIEFPNGFVFLRRLKVVRHTGAGILIAWDGADSAGPEILRTKEEAKTLTEELIGQLQKEPNGFAELAREHSNAPTAFDGGDMGTWFRGEMIKPFSQAFELLAEGEITTAPVETKYGYYIIRRDALPN